MKIIGAKRQMILNILLIIVGVYCVVQSVICWKNSNDSRQEVILERQEEFVDSDAREKIELMGKEFATYRELIDAELETKVEMANMTQAFSFKGTCLLNELPTVGMSVNDTWYVTDKKCNYTWNGSIWSQSSSVEKDDNKDLVVEIANNEIQKFDVDDFEIGTIADGVNSKSVTFAKARVRSKAILAYSSDIVIIPDGTKMLVSYYADEKESSYTHASGWVSEPFVINAEQHFRLLFAYEPSNKQDIVLDELLNRFTYCTKITYDVNKTIQSCETLDLIPEYYFKEGYLDKKIEDIMQKGYASTDSISFGYITDIHMDKNAGHSMKLLKYISERTPFVPFVVCGGDVCGEYADSVESIMDWGNSWYEMMSDYGKENVFQVRGNHDYNANGISDSSIYYTATESMIYHYVMGNLSFDINVPGGKMYYYIDIPSKKTRLIFIDDYEADETLSRAVKISQTQYDWLVNEALSNVENYNIILFSHQPCDEQYTMQQN